MWQPAVQQRQDTFKTALPCGDQAVTIKQAMVENMVNTNNKAVIEEHNFTKSVCTDGIIPSD